VGTDPYLVALKMLAGHELTEAQVRRRLARRGHEEAEIEQAVERLKANGTIDDSRAAAVIARRETSVRRRGKARVISRLHAAGVARSVADRAVEQAFQEFDADALLAASLERRLRGRTRIADEKEFNRLYRYLVGQGFEPGRVLTKLRSLQ
jgi:regulatory protein